MVPFGGWDMPLHYGSQIQEHHAVRRDAGLFDVSHMAVLDILGRDAQAYLRHLLANDVARLRQPGKALYSCMLTAHGGVIDDLILYYFAPHRYRLVVNAATAEKDLAWMRARLQGLEVEILRRSDLAMIAVQGPNARGKCLPILPPAMQAALCGLLARAAGAAGMAGGQAIDLASVGRVLTEAELRAMHRLKTGALLQAAVRMGAACAAPALPVATRAALEDYGAAVGLAFQVVDDILDVTADSVQLGKTAGKDAAADKPTYVSLLGLAEAQALAARLHAQAHHALDASGLTTAALLRSLADRVVMREN